MTRKKIAVKKYVVRLDGAERAFLEGIVRKGRNAAGKLTKAHILLKADASEGGTGWSDSRIVEAFGTSLATVYRVRQRFVEEGLEAALSRKKHSRPPVLPIFDEEKEAKLIQLACSKPPEGHARWSLRLLESKVVELNIVEAASDSTIGRVLKKTSFNLVSKNSELSHRKRATRL